MNEYKFFTLITTLLLLLSACRTAPIPQEQPMQPLPGMTLAQIETAIRAGIELSNRSSSWAGGSWFVESSHPGLTVAGLRVRSHYLQVTFYYTPQQITSRITGSDNLKQDGDSIHRNAISWHHRLNSYVYQGMVEVSQQPAMERALSDAEISGISQYARQSRIKLMKTGGVYAVPVKLNGVLDIYLIFDSGAAETFITLDVFLTLLKTGTIEQKDWLPGEDFHLADGSSVRSNRFRMKFIKIGNRTIKNINCAISNNIATPMLLGQSALEQLGKYTFDYENGVLIFN